MPDCFVNEIHANSFSGITFVHQINVRICIVNELHALKGLVNARNEIMYVRDINTFCASIIQKMSCKS